MKTKWNCKKSITLITFFKTLLKTFSCGLCYSESQNLFASKFGGIHFILLRENESKLLCLQEEHIPFNKQQKRHVTNIYTVEEKQKYHIIFFCKKNKVSYYITILLASYADILLASHAIFPPQRLCDDPRECLRRRLRPCKLSWKCFLLTYIILKILQQWWTNCQLNTEQYSKWRRADVSYGFHWNASLHANKMFQSVMQSLTKSPHFKITFCTSLWVSELFHIT